MAGGSSGNISDGGRMGSSTLSPEPVERDDDSFLQSYYQVQAQGRLDGDMATDGQIMPEADPFPILTTGDITEVVDQVAAQLTAGLQFSNASYVSQLAQGGGGDDDHVSIGIPPHQQIPATTLLPPAPVHLVRAIWTTSILTLVPAISTALYKPARGVLFGHNKLAYYSMLSAILALGLGEATTAFWLSRPGGASRRRLAFGRAVLCASVLPFITVLGIAGYGVMDG